MTNFYRNCFALLISGLVLSSIFLSNLSYANGSCSGFFVSSNGYIGTAAHCYSSKITVVVKRGFGSQVLPAQVVYINKLNDVMLLKVDVTDQPFFRVGQGVVGAPILVYGYPMPDILGPTLKVSRGTITSIDEKLLWVFATISPGNSGGPVVDRKTNTVVGIVSTAIFTGTAKTSVDGQAVKIEFLFQEMAKHNLDYSEDYSESDGSNAQKVVFLFME